MENYEYLSYLKYACTTSTCYNYRCSLYCVSYVEFFREPSVRNMRHSLATVILRLLCNRVVHEDADTSVNIMHSSLLKREGESPSEAASAAFVNFSVEGLFDRLLLVLHALLSDCLPSWLRSKPSMKTINEPPREFSGIDRELLETLQVYDILACGFSAFNFIGFYAILRLFNLV